jgi:large subunit ribosomal protein L25
MEATLEAVRRDGFGKNEARRLRKGGRIPAIFYGESRDAAGKPVAVPIAVDPKSLMRILHSDSGENTLIRLTIEGVGDTRVMLKEYQLDPVTHHLLHADLYRVAMDKRVTVTVPIVLRGEAPGVKQQGGIVDFVHREIEIECLPTEIPEHIEIDISTLMLGQSLRLRDVPETARWTSKTDLDVMLVHVIAPKAVEEAPAPEAEAAVAPAEPEIIKKGKPEKAEGEEKEE